ncbi:MAG: hypothetical protein FJZ63_07715 [Chlamydiae bacterium]|nr:hypothetical protein [Chlamydiota bacterium]
MVTSKCFFPLTEKPITLHASKWQQVAVLLDVSELQELLRILSPCHLVNVGKKVAEEQVLITQEQLLFFYQAYVLSLQGKDQAPKNLLPLALSKTLDPFYAFYVNEGHLLVQQKTPCIRVQIFEWFYLGDTEQFITKAPSSRGISWGLSFSFPQFYQDAETCQPIEILKNPKDLNTQLFKEIQKWVRREALMASFDIKGKKKVAPFKIGKKCLSWINCHQALSGEIVYADRSDHYRS